MIIDSHQHFWIYSRDRHNWIDDSMAIIRQDFLPSDLKPIYDQNNISGCIAIQADQTLKENDFLLNLSKENDFIKGIVGWVDLRKHNLEETLNFYGQYPIMKGYRHVVQAESDPLFLLDPKFLKGIAELQKRDLIYEILVFPHQLPSVLEFVQLFPTISFVLDHMAKPYIKLGYHRGWELLIKELGKIENVYCKISGIITEADYHSWKTTELLPYLQIVLEAFGAKRILYGSDWPVCLVAGRYDEVLNLADHFAEQLSENEKNDFFGNNSRKLYKIEN